MLEFKTDPKHLGYPSYSICADDEIEYGQLVAFVEANCTLAPGYQGELLPWNEQDRPSVVYATDQHVVFAGSQTRDTLKGSRICVGIYEFVGLLADYQSLRRVPIKASPLPGQPAPNPATRELELELRSIVTHALICYEDINPKDVDLIVEQSAKLVGQQNTNPANDVLIAHAPEMFDLLKRVRAELAEIREEKAYYNMDPDYAVESGEMEKAIGLVLDRIAYALSSPAPQPDNGDLPF